MARIKAYYLPDDKISGMALFRQWMLEDGTPYTGAYHVYKSTGEVYTESNYLNGISKPLIRYIDISDKNEKSFFEYNGLTQNKFNGVYVTPKPFRPIPTQNDYKRGYMERYIAIQFNYPNIYEISKTNFDELNNFLYTKRTFKWAVGKSKYTDIKEIANTNQKVLNLLRVDIPNITKFLTNLVEFSV